MEEEKRGSGRGRGRRETMAMEKWVARGREDHMQGADCTGDLVTPVAAGGRPTVYQFLVFRNTISSFVDFNPWAFLGSLVQIGLRSLWRF